MSVRTVSLGLVQTTMVRKRTSSGEASSSTDNQPLIAGRIEPAGALALAEPQENQMVQVAKAKTVSWTMVHDSALAQASGDAVPAKACPKYPDGSPVPNFIRLGKAPQWESLSQNNHGMGRIPVPNGLRRDTASS